MVSARHVLLWVRSAHGLPLNRIGLCCAAGVDSRVQSPCAEHVQVEVHAVPRLPHLRLRNPGRWVGASVCAETGQCRPARYARPSVTARCRTVPHGLLGQAVCTRTRICICAICIWAGLRRGSLAHAPIHRLLWPTRQYTKDFLTLLHEGLFENRAQPNTRSKPRSLSRRVCCALLCFRVQPRVPACRPDRTLRIACALAVTYAMLCASAEMAGSRARNTSGRFSSARSTCRSK
jgi:hypothetical protein